MKIGLSILRRKARTRRGALRSAFFHIAAALVVLCPLVLIEGVLRLCVPAPPIDMEDPYVSFSGRRPLFVPDSTGTHFVTAEDRLAAFRTQSFASVKGRRTFRIFCLGGSTVQGRPYSVETSFPTWLALNLRAARPEVDWEVVNCGGISYASYRLTPIMRELLGHEPDLVILYTGHNEFLEDRTYRRIKRMPPMLVSLHRAMLHLRSYGLADHWLSRRTERRTAKTVLSPEVRTQLDLRAGLEAYHRDEAWRQGVIRHFSRNLEAMVRLSRVAEVPLILVNPVSNLKDCPPFKSAFQAHLSPEQRQRMIALIARAGDLDWNDAYGKITLLDQAVGIDDRHAGLLYRIGVCHERLGRSAEAGRWFLRAKEEDICPLRMLEPMHEAIFDVATRHDVPLVDVRALIEQRADDGIPGNEWLLDHVHPSIAGCQLIADALYRTMEQMGLVRTPDRWQTVRDELRQQHLSSLNDAYYARGTAQLERLRQWSRGRIPEE